jgi:thiol:disulfide interchange protein DsbD
MEAKVWSNPEVQAILRDQVVLVSLYVDDRTELPLDEQVTSTIDGKVKNTLGRKLRDYQLTRFGKASQPLYVIVGHNEEVLSAPVGESTVEEYLAFLKAGLENFSKGQQ